MMSLGASGSIGNALTFASWKGRSYARELVTPSNPRSVAQTGVRSMMKFLSQAWTGLSAGEQASWEDLAAAGNYSEFNAYIKANLEFWRNFSAPTKETPATRAGTIGVLANEAATAVERSITIDIDITTANDNWGIAVFRGLVTSFGTNWNNLVQVIPATAIASFAWVDTPLDPDQYFYDFRAITDDGVLGAEHGEVNDTVT